MNEALVPQTHTMHWHESVAKGTWELQFDSVTFHGDVYAHSRAIVNPGFPFIGIPKNSWDQFKDNLIGAYPDEPVTCEDMDWCYFVRPCDAIIDKMPPLIFNMGEGNTVIEYAVPASSFLFGDKDRRTGVEYCHLGVVGQKYSDKNT